MRTISVNTWLLPSLLAGLFLSVPALAQDEEDTPYAYPDEDREDTPRRYSQEEPPRGSRRGSEDDGDFDRLSGIDDPNTGLAFEVLGGAMLLSSSRGAFAEFLPAVGGRFTWEYGRLFDSDVLREALWLDVRYTFAGMEEGTTLITTNTRVHYATIAPAYEVTFGQGSDYGVYGQVGGGVAYEMTALNIGGKETPVNGLKSLIQYGVGLRGRTRLSSGSNMRLAWRVELMRFRRGYMDDTFLGTSVGIAF
jgi:hypothetical protein